ncbi:MAG: molecular chaperone HtpG [Eubacteriales bacterium]
MKKTEFKAESKRLMDLMIHSIYTNKEIFLRELISNASDAEDKLAYLALTDDSVSISRDDLKITLTPDKEARTLTLVDNGIGMSKEDLSKNLGTIAHSGSLKFKEEMDKAKGEDIDVIGQFGVGFYSAFMVADKVVVTSKQHGAEEGFVWTSEGTDGFTIQKAKEDPTVGTTIVMHIKESTDDEDYEQFLEEKFLQSLIRKYSDYIRYPIQMEVDDQNYVPVEGAETPEGEEPKMEWVTTRVVKTLNSMVPIWQKPKSKVTEEEYQSFYQEKFGDWQPPLSTVHTSVEGNVTYKALIYVPSAAPYDFYTREYEKGLQLYSSGVLIMEKCGDLLPDHFRFARGVVDSQDFSLNISRELLQQNQQVRTIAKNLEKKIKAELLKLQKDDRDKYETFWKAFGAQLKFGVVAEFSQHKEILQDLLLFWSSKEDKNVTLAEYQERMPEDQPYLYYACGNSVTQLSKLPQVERILDKGYEVLYCFEDVDDFVMKGLGKIGEKMFKSVTDEDALPKTDEEKAEQEKKTEEGKPVLDAIKEVLGDKVHAVRISSILKRGTAVISTEGSVSLEMEKYMAKLDGGANMTAQRVLEFNPDSTGYKALQSAVEANNTDLIEKYAKLSYGQAILLADLPLEDPADFVSLISDLMV